MTENMGYRKYRAGRRWLRAGAPLALVLVGLVAAAAVARAGDPLNRGSKNSQPLIADRVTIGRIAVGGYTARQAADAAEDAFSQRLALTTDRRIQLISPGRLGAHALVADAVAGAFRAQPGEDVSITVAVDPRHLDRYVSAMNKRYARASRDARIKLVGLRPVVKPQQDGVAVRQRALFAKLASALSTGDRMPIRIPFKHVKPAVTASDFKTAVVIQRSSNRLVVWDGRHRWGTFGVATGQAIYPTPLGQFSIVTKQMNPWWYPPDSPWAAGLSPVPPGPGNPLGTRWMGLSAPGVGIHGTPDAASIGYSASHGCIRMRIPDAERVFDHVSVGTPVFIVPA
jgi:hypothetical protein